MATPRDERSEFYGVPKGRLELPWLAPHDFESCVYTNSTTWA